ncbi:TetR/AcrR family transcriptional regulator [Iamia sp. SCSIO 61187]|uniref:TetR/AcrR family transcriptional regulator n=1 Tax=Iamia sp. SCSIO 61187 TaxID=2722752 RepID=UPI001C6288E7|nr:TetR/AcrR family transcriptional regulator [Iamia sp. SCSIO 61187]
MNPTRAYSMTNRSARAETTRLRIIEAAMALFLEHAYGDVTLTQIAETAGVSHQTVLNHFESKAGVVAGVADHMSQQTMAARAAAPGDVVGAVHALVGEYERIGDANARWAIEPLDELAALMEQARAGHQRWLVEVFGDALPEGRTARRRAINALHAATDVYTWKLLRRDLRLSRGEAEKTMIALVEGILPGGTP